jgi:MerR family transcriptional regulator, heat shock protein HspR
MPGTRDVRGRTASGGPAGRGAGAIEDLGVYVISVAAQLAGVHPQTLRIYERRGLLNPQRTSGNSRRYSQRDVDRLRRIQRLTQEEGVNLAGVRIIMDLERQMARIRDEMDVLRRRVDQVTSEMNDRGRRSAWGTLVRLDDVRNIFETVRQA